MTSPVDCVFCLIRDHKLPAAWVLDEPKELAFLDAHPLFFGHVLIVPRRHHRNIFDAPAEDTGALFSTARRVALAVKAATGCDGIFMASNNGVSQSVDHLHIHVVPRHKKDGLRGFMWPRKRYDDDQQAQEMAEMIRVALADIPS